ncbi:hypothetical protein HMPREF9700_00380 [Bergeyella zoohelcum CCUG 30536]|uniref:Uncharacterized protein n=1 Tax=Bergeyella zoohelcum TaxID=1015 RepID=A0A376BZE0_9FLAO|nr:hypothetical protein HMPREF9700_00380 [Bergeyella zoohelcum CCUG 30536]SSZ47023.1 Uncharacterised protein [Bergeyella zoohelcum]
MSWDARTKSATEYLLWSTEMNDYYMRPLHGKKRKKIIQTIDC